MPDVPYRRRPSSGLVWFLRITLLLLAISIAGLFFLRGDFPGWLTRVLNLKPPAARPDRVRVPVAAGMIRPYQLLREDDLRFVPTERSQVPPGAVLDPKAILGRRVLHAMLPGQHFTKAALADPGRITDILPPGWVATRLDPAALGGPVDLLEAGSAVALLACPRDGGKVSLITRRTIVLFGPPEARSGKDRPGRLVLMMPARDQIRLVKALYGSKIHVMLLSGSGGDLPVEAFSSEAVPGSTPPIQIIRGTRLENEQPASVNAGRGAVPEEVESPGEDPGNGKED